ncbi:MAG: amidase, partial [Pseudomonadota bacterium]|nr:amidase [Pseudomonadota bacterium]
MNLPVQYTPGSGLNSFAGKADQFLRGEDTPSNFLDQCIASINTQEPEVKAWVTTRLDAVRAEAETADKRYASGTPLSPVDGMPIGVKDVIQTRDMPTKFGSPIFENNETGFDSASVDALRRAGALIVGKSVTTEFAFVKPGPTRNPFDTTKTPGGSSSG